MISIASLLFAIGLSLAAQDETLVYFAELDKDDNVIRVIVVDEKNTLDENGQPSEAVGIAFCQALLGKDTRWVQTRRDGQIGIADAGAHYDKSKDQFLPSAKP